MTTNTFKAGQTLERLVEIMARLRGENGCPWDKEQTHQSLKPYALEETYEVLEAIDLGRMDKLEEELGDLLLQVVFHAQLAAENGEFTIDDVINNNADKLIRRHPHVFGDITVSGVAGVLENWDRIKQGEKQAERQSVLDGVPKDFPALLRSEKIQSKAAKVGFDWSEIEGPLQKTKEEFAEFEEILRNHHNVKKGTVAWQKLEDEFGDILFSMVNVARFFEINPEIALNRTNAKFIKRFHYIESEAAKLQKELKQMSLQEMDELWEKGKGVV